MRSQFPLSLPTGAHAAKNHYNLTSDAGGLRPGLRGSVRSLGSTNWAPTLVRELPEFQGADSATLTRSVSYAIMALNAEAIFGYLGFGPLADRFGRRAVFAFMCIGSFVMLPATYLLPSHYSGVLLLLPVLGFFNNGIFSRFPIYLPGLYPTRLRATGAAFASTRAGSLPPRRLS